MSVKIEYVCDRCGAASPTPDRYWRLHLQVTPWDRGETRYLNGQHAAIWCQKCVEERGVLPHTAHTRHGERKPAEKLDTLIREICRQEIEEGP